MPFAGSPAAIFEVAYSWNKARALSRRRTVILGNVSSLQRESTRLSQRLTPKLRVFTVRLHRTFGDPSPHLEIPQGHIVRTGQQLTTNSIRTAGRNAFACAATTVVASQIALASQLAGFGSKPWMHERDPRKHPGQEDV